MENEAEGKNRRKSERLDVAFTLVYGIEKPFALRIKLGLVDEIDASMINLSDLGMAVTTEYDIPIDTELSIKFNIIDLCLSGDERWRKMEIIGQVASHVTVVDENSKLSHRIGIRFVNISSEDKFAISDFIKRNMFRPIIPGNKKPLAD
jgi:c-di-GMP-binding flagellar brake protein YcgR